MNDSPTSKRRIKLWLEVSVIVASVAAMLGAYVWLNGEITRLLP